MVKILVTGIGITGKSTFRRNLVGALRCFGFRAEHFDADMFQEIRHPFDEDCLSEFPKNNTTNILIVEDVHGPTNEALIPLRYYDFIFYLKPNLFAHILFWIPRILAWFNKGKFSWEAGKGWKGTGKPRDPRNILPIIMSMLRDFRNRQRWIYEDLQVLKKSPTALVKVYWSFRGPQFRIQLPQF